MKPSEVLENVPWIRGNMYSEECECHVDSDIGFKSLDCTNGVCMLGAVYLTIQDSNDRLDFTVAIGRVMGWLDQKVEAVQIERMITTYNDTRCPDKDKAVEVLKEAEDALEKLFGFDFDYREVPID